MCHSVYGSTLADAGCRCIRRHVVRRKEPRTAAEREVPGRAEPEPGGVTPVPAHQARPRTHERTDPRPRRHGRRPRRRLARPPHRPAARRPYRRLVAEALGGAGDVLDVGAGAGSRRRRAAGPVVPSGSALARRPALLPRAVDAVAEDLPFFDGKFDGAMSLVSVHHWNDTAAGLSPTGSTRRTTAARRCSWNPPPARRPPRGASWTTGSGNASTGHSAVTWPPGPGTGGSAIRARAPRTRGRWSSCARPPERRAAPRGQAGAPPCLTPSVLRGRP